MAAIQFRLSSVTPLLTAEASMNKLCKVGNTPGKNKARNLRHLACHLWPDFCCNMVFICWQHLYFPCWRSHLKPKLCKVGNTRLTSHNRTPSLHNNPLFLFFFWKEIACAYIESNGSGTNKTKPTGQDQFYEHVLELLVRKRAITEHWSDRNFSVAVKCPVMVLLVERNWIACTVLQRGSSEPANG